MDPYLEDPALWPDVHFGLIASIRRYLQPLLVPHYYAHLGERLYIEDVRHALYPDVTVLRAPAPAATTGAAGTLVADEPVIVPLTLQYRERFLEIRATSTHEVVTVIEVISPANKSAGGRGRDEYRRKQDEVLESQANLVEIDLHRRGPTVVMAPPVELISRKRFDYVVCVNRATARDQAELYAFTVRERLPRVRVPLRNPGEDVVLDLPAVVQDAYEEGVYSLRIDYGQAPMVPLSPQDAMWAEELLREVGLRLVDG
jgi:hypothetical protein